MLLLIAIPFIIALLLPMIQRTLFQHVHIGWFVLIVPTVLFLALARYIPDVAKGKTFVETLDWMPTYGIQMAAYLDGLSLLFALLITGMGALVTLYSIFYLSTRESLPHFYIYLLLFMGAMLGLVLQDNLIVLYVFWELTSISSFLLIAFWFYRSKSRYGAQKSLLITVSGGIAMLAGFIILYTITGTFSIREIIASIDLYMHHDLFVVAMLCILLGAFTKSVQFPFHIWLPDAMEAPTPVSAYLHSATMVKAGLYLIARFTPIFGNVPLWLWIISSIGLITLFWGSFTAVRQTDLKALLAYSTVSQLGLIMSLLGVGAAAYAYDLPHLSLATFVAFFHLINHATFKGALFMVIGIIDHTIGSRDTRRLGGLIALMPVTFTIAFIGTFSMAGLPPFNGFLSKEMFFTAMLQARELDFISLSFPLIAWIASVFTFVYSMIILLQTFFGKFERERFDRPVREASFGMVIAPSILALFIIGIFFFPNTVSAYFLQPIMLTLFAPFASRVELVPHIQAWHGINTELLMTIGIVIIGTLLYTFFRYWQGVYKLFPERWSFDALYNRILDRGEIHSRTMTKAYMTGSLRHYFMYIFLFLIVTVGGMLIFSHVFTFSFAQDAPITMYEWIIIVVMAVAGIAILFAQTRLTAILLNGVLGFSIAALFVIFRAPDLALTQLVVEAVTTVLFLLCFYFLPRFKLDKVKERFRLSNALIAVAVGVIFIVIALAVNSNRFFDTIAAYFEQAYELTGSLNIVNTILGDFRAFDTMLEVVVLFLAGLGVYMLIKFKREGEERNVED